MDDLDLEQLKQQLGNTPSDGRFTVDEIMREAERDDHHALSQAAEQTYQLIDEQDALAGQEEADPLGEQEDVFAQMVANIEQYEQSGETSEDDGQLDVYARMIANMQQYEDEEPEDEEPKSEEPQPEQPPKRRPHVHAVSLEHGAAELEPDEPEKDDTRTMALNGQSDWETLETEEQDVYEQPEDEEPEPQKGFLSRLFGEEEDEEPQNATDASAYGPEPDDEQPSEHAPKQSIWSKLFRMDDAMATDFSDLDDEESEQPLPPEPEHADEPEEIDREYESDGAEDSEPSDEIEQDEQAASPRGGFWSRLFRSAQPEKDEEANDEASYAAAEDAQKENAGDVTEAFLGADEMEERDTDQVQTPTESDEIPEQTDTPLAQTRVMPQSEPYEPEPLTEQQLFAQTRVVPQAEPEQTAKPETQEDLFGTAPITDTDDFWSRMFRTDKEAVHTEPTGQPDATDFSQTMIYNHVMPQDIAVPEPSETVDGADDALEVGKEQFAAAMAEPQETVDGASPEQAEPDEEPEQDAPHISEEELQEFLSDAKENSGEPAKSFEELLRDSGAPEQEEKPIAFDEFPEKETTVYFDIAVPQQTQEKPRAQLFDAEEALEEAEAQRAEKEEQRKLMEDCADEWVGMSLDQLCEVAPPLAELRRDGPVMVREVERQKARILERRRRLLEKQQRETEQRKAEQEAEQRKAEEWKAEQEAEQRKAERPAEQAQRPSEPQAETTEAEDMPFFVMAQDLTETSEDRELRQLEQEPAAPESEEKDPVFPVRSTDKPLAEPAGREQQKEPDKPDKQTDAHEDAEKRKSPQASAPPRGARIWPRREVPQDVHGASRACRSRAQALAKRSIVVALLTAVALYLSCAADFGAPLPDILNFAGNPTYVLIALCALQVLAMALAYDVVILGIRALIHGSPNFATLVDIMLLLNLIHAVTCILWLGEEIPYIGIAMLALFAQMRTGVADASAQHYVYKTALHAQQPSGVFVHAGDEPLLVMAPLSDVQAFLRCEAEQTLRQRVERVLTILAVVIAVVLSAIVCAGTGDVGRLPYVLAATLTGACQIALLCVGAMGERNAARHMMKAGGAIAGMGGARALASASTVVLTDEQLFPKGSVLLERVELRSNFNDATAIAYAAALAQQSSLREMLEEEVHTRYATPVTAQHVVHYSGGGARGIVGGVDILLGDEDFLESNGIEVRDVPRDSLLLSVAGQLVAALVIDYQVSAAQFNAVQLLTERHMRILLHTRNRQVTPQLVERLYGLREGSVVTAELEQDRAMSNPAYTSGDAPQGMLLRGGLSQLASCVSSAKSLNRLSVLGLTLGVLATVIGMLLIAYLCYVFAPADARPIRVLLYMILWFIPIFFIENEVGKD